MVRGLGCGRSDGRGRVVAITGVKGGIPSPTTAWLEFVLVGVMVRSFVLSDLLLASGALLFIESDWLDSALFTFISA